MLPPQNIILFKLDFNVKFPLLRLKQFLSDLKSTIFRHSEVYNKGDENSNIDEDDVFTEMAAAAMFSPPPEPLLLQL